MLIKQQQREASTIGRTKWNSLSIEQLEYLKEHYTVFPSSGAPYITDNDREESKEMIASLTQLIKAKTHLSHIHIIKQHEIHKQGTH